MKRGPRPVPTHLRLLRGNPSHRPINHDEPQPDIPEGCPSPLEFLEPCARDEWWRLAPELYRLQLLSALDVAAFAAYCASFSRWKRAEEILAQLATSDPAMHGLLIKHEDSVGVNPLVHVSRKAAESMLRAATEFGLTPAARSRISAGIHGEDILGKFTGLIPDGAQA
jgi:P27 family predicted phage terminase small subunit